MNRSDTSINRSKLDNKDTPLGAQLLECVIEFLMLPETWRRRHQQNMMFARVEARVLRDVGISEAQRFVAMNRTRWK